MSQKKWRWPKSIKYSTASQKFFLLKVVDENGIGCGVFTRLKASWLAKEGRKEEVESNYHVALFVCPTLTTPT